MNNPRRTLASRMVAIGIGVLVAAAGMLAAPSASAATCAPGSGVVLTTSTVRGVTTGGTLRNCDSSTAKAQFVVGSKVTACTTLRAGASTSYALTAAERRAKTTLSWRSCGAATPTSTPTPTPSAIPTPTPTPTATPTPTPSPTPVLGSWQQFIEAPNTNHSVCATSTSVVGMSDKAYDGPYLIGAGTSYVYNCTAKTVRVQAEMTSFDEAAGESGSYLTACSPIAAKSSARFAKSVGTGHSESPLAWRTC